MIERLECPSAAELDALTLLWEASVRTTHDFLPESDIGFYRRLVRNEALLHTPLYVIRDNDRFAAFMGVEADTIEMLFVAPEQRGNGMGRRMVEYAVEQLGARRVDVNEQNTQAAGFYTCLGFRVVSRAPLDSAGKPYPILHLER